MPYSHPIAKVIACTRADSVIRTRIFLDRTEGGPIAPSSLWVGDPPREKDARLVFRLHRLVAQTGKVFEFESSEEYEPQTPLPTEGSEFYFVGWWGQDQLDLAQSDIKALTRYRFVSNDPEDHDHCRLCWKSICAEDDDCDREAYTNGNESVCFECYDKYIVSGFGKYLGNTT
jgi:hypothetical protein